MADISPNTSTRRSTKTLNVNEKMEVILAVSAGNRKRKEIAADFGISIATMSAIIKNQDRIKSLSARGMNDLRREREAMYPDVEEHLVEWVNECHRTQFPLNGKLIRDKADEIARHIGRVGFKGSNGWLDRFKKRNGLRFGPRRLREEMVDAILPDDDSFMSFTSPSLTDTNGRLWSMFETGSPLNPLTDESIPECDIKIEQRDEYDDEEDEIEKPNHMFESKRRKNSNKSPYYVDESDLTDKSRAEVISSQESVAYRKIKAKMLNPKISRNVRELESHKEARKMMARVKDYVERSGNASFAILEAVKLIQDFIDDKIAGS